MFDYKKIAFIYLSLSLIILTSALYFTFYRATIIIEPATEIMSLSFDLTVREVPFISPEDINTIPGKIFSQEQTMEESFPATSSQKVATSALASVTLINTTNQPQTLVATTRLLTPQNQLFRIKNRVVVPAQGQIETEVYPDDAKLEVDLGSTRLIIPGLSKSLQEKIYAHAQSITTGASREVKVIAQADLDKAKEDIIKKLEEQIVSQFKSQLANGATKIGDNIFASESLKIVSSREVLASQSDHLSGDVADSFKQTARLKIVSAIFDEVRLLDLAQKRLRVSMPADKQLIDIKKDSFNYLIENYNLDTKTVNLKVSVDGQMIISNKSGLLEKNKLADLSRDEVSKYFVQSPAIKSVEVKFLPFWLKRTPKAIDRINIVISKPQ